MQDFVLHLKILSDTSQRLLDHLKEAGFFSAKDLDSIEHRFEIMRETIRRGQNQYSPHLLTLLSNRLDTCHKILEELQASIADVSPDLVPIYEKLVSILRSMATANTRSVVGQILKPCSGKLLTYVHSFPQQRSVLLRTN